MCPWVPRANNAAWEGYSKLVQRPIWSSVLVYRMLSAHSPTLCHHKWDWPDAMRSSEAHIYGVALVAGLTSWGKLFKYITLVLWHYIFFEDIAQQANRPFQSISSPASDPWGCYTSLPTVLSCAEERRDSACINKIGPFTQPIIHSLWFLLVVMYEQQFTF